MVDQELDALLVGALYGELLPADEARLAAHLESHPTDRAALEDLRSMRQTLRESRFFEHVDPPASVSAIILREAARRAPSAPRATERDPEDGWFARLTRVFARPAVAGVLTLVVAVGVAGTLYMRPDRDAAGPHIAEAPARSEAAEAVATAAPAPSSARAGDATTAAAANAPATGNGVVVGVADKEENQDVRRAAAETKKAGPAKIQAIEIDGKNELQPKDMDADDRSQMAVDMPAAKPAHAVKTAAHAAKPTPTSPPPAQQEQPDQAAGSADGWARDQHAHVATLVKDGNCQDAAQRALEIKNRAPGYYTANVANDRSLAPCKAYIAGAVDKQEKADAAKAAVKVDANSR